MNQEIREILESVAELCEFYTEYSGRSHAECFFCGANLDDADDHKEGCEHILAKKILQNNP
jgi:hypothetical protein